MKALITGGAGLLGSALANRLLAEGNRVRVLDDLSAGERERLDPGVAFSGGDMRDLPKLYGLCYEVSIASVIWQHESVCPNRSSIL